MKRFTCTLFLLAGLLAPPPSRDCSAQDTEPIAPAAITQPGAVRSVTLYRDRALVTREIIVPAGERSRSIVVPDLPEQIDPDSVFADGEPGTMIRAVRVSSRPAEPAQRTEVRELNEKIDDLNQQVIEARQVLEVVDRNIQSLEKLVNFAAATAHSDLNRGVLDAETLTKLVNFSMSKRHDLAQEQLEHQRKVRGLESDLNWLKIERSQVTEGGRSRNFQATVFVEAEDEGPVRIRLSYLVDGCGWSPQYTVRGYVGRPSVGLRYSALVQQMSGENWDNVELVLSTATPAVNAARPMLTPLRVVSVDPEEADTHLNANYLDDSSADTMDQLTAMIGQLREQQQFAEAELGLWSEEEDGRDDALNTLAGMMQQIELHAESKSWRMLAPDADNDVTSQVYRLQQLVSLDTRREQQLVKILEADLAGEMYHVASPLLSSYAYREVQVANEQPLGLLGGPATIYLDDRFVGRLQIPSTASGQPLVIGFGADQQVRTRRELMDKKDVLRGGNRELTFDYRLVISNYKDQPIAVRLIDRMANTRQANQLSIDLASTEHPLSDDALYLRMQRPTGVLRWDLTVPENREGDMAFDVHYRYTMEFDRNRIPTTHHTLAEMQASFDARGMGGGGFGGGLGAGQFDK